MILMWARAAQGNGQAGGLTLAELLLPVAASNTPCRTESRTLPELSFAAEEAAGMAPAGGVTGVLLRRGLTPAIALSNLATCSSMAASVMLMPPVAVACRQWGRGSRRCEGRLACGRGPLSNRRQLVTFFRAPFQELLTTMLQLVMSEVNPVDVGALGSVPTAAGKYREGWMSGQSRLRVGASLIDPTRKGVQTADTLPSLASSLDMTCCYSP